MDSLCSLAVECSDSCTCEVYELVFVEVAGDRQGVGLFQTTGAADHFDQCLDGTECGASWIGRQCDRLPVLSVLLNLLGDLHLGHGI